MTDSQQLETQNKRALRKLVLTVAANPQSLELLVAVCDDRNLQAAMIEAYEAELQERGVGTFRARLNPKEPSLRRSLQELVDQEPTLQTGEPAVVTVLNAEALLGVTLGEEKSEQERFFFSLQWTREALRRFEFAVVLWVPDSVATRIGQRAPDFWSWRGGVFEFESAPKIPAADSHSLPKARELETESQRESLSIDDLMRQVAGLEETSPDSALLITSYNELGKAYERRYDYQKALALYEKALALAKQKNNLAGQARSLRNLGLSLKYSGRAAQAIDYYEQSLEIVREMGDRNDEASALISLGNAYNALGQYQRAIDCHQQSLEIVRKFGDLNGEANSLNNLGITYDALGQHQRAIDCHQQSLEIKREIGDLNGEAKSLNNLGEAYRKIGQYQRAIDFYQQSLEIVHEFGDLNGEANSLNNLGSAYSSLGQYQRAIDFYQQSLEIKREIGDLNGEAASLGNLGIAYKSLGQYQRAIDFYQQSLEIKREIGDLHGEATALFNKGLSLAKLDQKWEAQSCYEAARQIYKDLTLQKDIEDCDEAIQNLGQIISPVPTSVPIIEKSQPSAATVKRRKKRALAIYFLLGVGLVLFLWWLFQ